MSDKSIQSIVLCNRESNKQQTQAKPQRNRKWQKNMVEFVEWAETKVDAEYKTKWKQWTKVS